MLEVRLSGQGCRWRENTLMYFITSESEESFCSLLLVV